MTETSVEEIVARFEADHAKVGELCAVMPNTHIAALAASWRERGEAARAAESMADYWQQAYTSLAVPNQWGPNDARQRAQNTMGQAEAIVREALAKIRRYADGHDDEMVPVLIDEALAAIRARSAPQRYAAAERADFEGPCT